MMGRPPGAQLLAFVTTHSALEAMIRYMLLNGVVSVNGFGGHAEVLHWAKRRDDRLSMDFGLVHSCVCGVALLPGVKLNH